MAEKAGFEPAVRFEPYTRFPGVHLKPLGHFSSLNKPGAKNKPDLSFGQICFVARLSKAQRNRSLKNVFEAADAR